MPISNLDAIRSFVFVFNHRFCLNSAADWSRRLKIPTAFSFEEFEELLKIVVFKTVLYVLIRYGTR